MLKLDVKAKLEATARGLWRVLQVAQAGHAQSQLDWDGKKPWACLSWWPGGLYRWLDVEHLPKIMHWTRKFTDIAMDYPKATARSWWILIEKSSLVDKDIELDAAGHQFEPYPAWQPDAFACCFCITWTVQQNVVLQGFTSAKACTFSYFANWLTVLQEIFARIHKVLQISKGSDKQYFWQFSAGLVMDLKAEVMQNFAWFQVCEMFCCRKKC